MLLLLFLIAVDLICEILELPLTLPVHLSSIVIPRCVCLFPEDFFATSDFLHSGLKNILFSKIHFLLFIHYQFNKHLPNTSFIPYNAVCGDLKMGYMGSHSNASIIYLDFQFEESYTTERRHLSELAKA